MLVQLICFVILLFLVIKFAMKPAMRVLNERQNHIHAQITGAEEANKKAASLVEEQLAKLEEAKREAQAIIEQAKKQKDAEGDQIIKAAQERAERLIKDAASEIENEKNRAIAELREQVGTLSVLLASKIIENEVDDKYNGAMINDFLKQVEGRV